MGNEWREHVKKTMASMKASGKKVMLKDVLKQAAKTYKKGSKSVTGGKTQKKKSSKRKTRKAKSGKRKH